MLYDYLFVDSFGLTAGKEDPYINILYVKTDDHCVFPFSPVGMCTYFDIMIYTF